MPFDYNSFLQGVQTGLRLGRTSPGRVPPQPPVPSGKYILAEDGTVIITERPIYPGISTYSLDYTLEALEYSSNQITSEVVGTGTMCIYTQNGVDIPGLQIWYTHVYGWAVLAGAVCLTFAINTEDYDPSTWGDIKVDLAIESGQTWKLTIPSTNWSDYKGVRHIIITGNPLTEIRPIGYQPLVIYSEAEFRAFIANLRIQPMRTEEVT